MSQTLSDNLIKSLPVPNNKLKIYWDNKIIGLGLRITKNNARAFVLRYVINGRERIYTIGSFPELDTASAKKEALKLKSAIFQGSDPLEKRSQIYSIPTLKELASDFLKTKEKSLRPKTFEGYKVFLLEKHILPKLGGYRVDAISKRDVELLFSSYSHLPRTANRLVGLLHLVFNTAIAWGVISSNPAKGIKKYREEKRDRYLSEAEIKRLMEVLIKEPNQMNANIIKLILLTGSRKGEVLSARWQDFDFANRLWTKPAFLTKQNKASYIPLNNEVVKLLLRMRTEANDTSDNRLSESFPPKDQKTVNSDFSTSSEHSENTYFSPSPIKVKSDLLPYIPSKTQKRQTQFPDGSYLHQEVESANEGSISSLKSNGTKSYDKERHQEDLSVNSAHITLSPKTPQKVPNQILEPARFARKYTLRNHEGAITANGTYLFYNPRTKTHIKHIERFWRLICKKANIPKVRIHDLRHTFASTLVNSGVSLEVIGKLIGHSNIRTTERYSHLANNTLRAASEVFGEKVMGL